jgi:hypothetical protein
LASIRVRLRAAHGNRSDRAMNLGAMGGAPDQLQ